MLFSKQFSYTFTDGIKYKSPDVNSPHYKLGQLIVDPLKFVGWLQGYVNQKEIVLDIRLSKTGKPYIKLGDK